MPRNSQGLYTLPLPPVLPNELIESVWANTTNDDIASALTGSLPRDGSAPMTGDLTLASGPPQTSRSAVSKAYMDSFLAYATGMPIGSIVTFAANTVPGGYLLCNGQAVSRATYADLFATIGTTFGSGDGSTTFNVPDLRDQFIRGKNDSRTLGSTQAGSIASHTHPVQDPTHSHGVSASQAAHSHTITTNSHSHGVSDPGHSHSANSQGLVDTNLQQGGPYDIWYNPGSTGAALTGISIQAAGDIGGSTNSQQPAVTVGIGAAATGISLGATGGAETVPQNIALVYLIKAENDTSGGTTVVSVTTSDANMISVDESAPQSPELVIHSNVAFGIPKLDASGKIPQSLVDISTFQYLGPWNASGGQNPSQALPSEVFYNGDLYQISVGGDILLYDAAGTPSLTTVVSTDQIAFITDSSVGLPTGWYFQPTAAITGITAGAVSFIPTGTIGSTNVQNAIVEVANESTPLSHVGTGGTQHAAVTTSAAGFMSAADKTKLDGVEANAQVNTVQSVNTKTGAVVLTASDVGALTQAGADALYVNVGGDTMTGPLNIAAIQSATGNPAIHIDTAGKVTFPQGPVQTGPAFYAYRTTQQSGSPAGPRVPVKVQLTNERFDTANAFDSTSNYRFTPQVAGYYQVSFGADIGSVDTLNYPVAFIQKNGVTTLAGVAPIDGGGQFGSTGSGLVYMNGTTDYLELWASTNTTTNPWAINGEPSGTSTFMSAFLARGA